MLEIKNVSKIFNADSELDRKVALDGINLTIEDGEFVTIIGGNGSGKSTLMNVISGIYKPNSGNIIIDGEDLTNSDSYQRSKVLGHVFQDPLKGTCASMSLLENLEIAYRRPDKKHLRWGFKKDHEEFFKEELSRLNLGLEERLNAKIGLLSGGQRQAVTLLMATLRKPKVLLLDEHTAALDPKTAAIVLETTDEIVRSSHITTLMITHNMKDAIKYGDRLIMLRNGHVIFDVKGEEKQKLTPNALVEMFNIADTNLI